MVDKLPQQFRPVVISLSHTKQHLSWWYHHYIPIESPHNGNYSPNIKHPHSTVWSQYVCQSRACYHVFWGIYVYMHAGYAVKEGKKHAGPRLQKWAHVAAQAKGTFQKVQGCPCCSAASMRGWTLETLDMCTASGTVQDPGLKPRHPQTSKLTYFRTLQSSYTRKGSKTGFCEWQRWFLGSGAMFACACPHTSRGSNAKLAIRIGLAAKLLRMCSKATKHGVAFRIGLAAKLLRMCSKATKDNFAIRIGSAAKLLRKCSKE